MKPNPLFRLFCRAIIVSMVVVALWFQTFPTTDWAEQIFICFVVPILAMFALTTHPRA